MKKILSVLLLMLVAQAHSFTPESGHWWDPNASGSGYTLEIQDNHLFGSFYVYDDLGNPIWFTTSGFLDGNSYYDSFVAISYDGSCIGCAYQAPETVLSSYESVTIDFLTETTAKMTFKDQAPIYIERFNYFLGDELQKMRGEWQLVMDVSNYTNDFPFIADVLVFEQTEIFQGDYLVTGCRSETTDYNNCTNYALSHNDLAAFYDTQYNELVAVVRDDANHYIAYYLKTGTDQFDGEAYSYPVGSSPNFDAEGFRVRGFRSASYTFVATETGPSKSTSTQKARPGLASLIDGTVIVKEQAMDQTKAARLHDIIKRLEARLTNK